MSTIDIPGLITSEANSQGVPPNIALAVAQQESGMNQGAVGSSGEIGIFQLLPSSFPGVDASDVYTNVQTGIGYLASLFQRFGTWASALAAYNAGPSAVQSGNIPASTQSYVTNVLNMAGYTPSTDTIFSDGSADGSIAPSTPAPMWLAPVLLIGLGIAAWWAWGD